ncbi:MAG: LamG domain-containing protein, partial [Clostridia bacterium]|nr:LamG domain-containing protein [Clostridia bacterium]
IAYKLNYKRDSVTVSVTKNKTAIADIRLKYEVSTNNQGLLIYLPFNGNANDESGNNYNGIVNGAILAKDRFGRDNKAFYFSGNNSYIQVNNLPQLNTNFTYCAWIKIDTTSLSDRGYNFGCYGKENAGVASWDIGYYPMRNYFAVFNRPSDVWTKGYALDNNWHFILITFGNNSKSLFIDGNFVDSKSISLPIPILPNNNLRIGAHISDGSQQFRGYIDDIRLYNYVLSSSEIMALYKEGGWIGQNQNSLPLSNINWICFSHASNIYIRPSSGAFELVPEGLKFYGTGYRQGAIIHPTPLMFYTITNKTIYFKWKAFGGTGFSYMGVGPVIFTDTISWQMPSYPPTYLTTHHSYLNSYVITENKWYYTRITFSSNTFNAVTAENNYDNRGGIPVQTRNGTLDRNYKFFGFGLGDNYAGTSAYAILGEVIIE